MTMCCNLHDHVPVHALGRKTMVVAASSDAPKKIMQAEGKYPMRFPYEREVMWIMEKNNFPTHWIYS